MVNRGEKRRLSDTMRVSKGKDRALRDETEVIDGLKLKIENHRDKTADMSDD